MDLFDAPSIPGLAYHPRVLEPAEQASLVASVRELAFVPFKFQRWEGKRRVAWFGWRYDYDDAELVAAPPFPPYLLGLRERVAALAELPAEALEQGLVTEYQVGAGIGWHRDRPSFDRVAGVSLLSPRTLRFRRRRPGGFDRVARHLEPGSVYVLTGPARYEWEHSIAEMVEPRYSITFRSLLEGGAARRSGDRVAGSPR